MRRFRRATAAVAAASLITLLAGCSDGPSTENPDQTASSTDGGASDSPGAASEGADESGDAPEVGAEVPVEEFTARLTGGIEALTTGQIEMTDVEGTELSGEFDYTTDPASFASTMSSADASIQVITLDGWLYSELGEGGETPWTKTKATDEAAFADPATQLLPVMERVRAVTHTGSEAVDGVQTDHYTITADGPNGPTGAPGEADALTVGVWLDAEDRPVKFTQESGQLSRTWQLAHLGEPVEITAPPADQIRDN